MRLEFSLRGLPGHVDITVAPVDVREAVGAWPAPPGLPACEATISYPGQGYTGLFGWVQLVRSTDNSSGGRGFDMDPLELLGDVSHPFGFFGIRPTLFDAPSRHADASLDWVAHSFLTYPHGRLSQPELDRILALPSDEQEEASFTALKAIRALLGFSWGFTLAAGQAAIVPAAVLDHDAWNAHIPMLTSSYPDWTFAPDFHG